ncbi:MAG: TRAP transporter small permease [Alphaproteobacteria bacterium]|nr:TRAP transporter small permease [Alphaproteobacteria bacterium]
MRRALDRLDRSVELIVAAILAAMVVVGLLQVTNRFVLNASLSWTEEVQVFGHIWLIFLGIPVAYRHGAHMSVEMLHQRYPGPIRTAFDLMVELLWASFAVATAYLSYRVSQVAAFQQSPGLEIPMSYPYYGMVIGGAYLFLVVLRRIADRAHGFRTGTSAP